jgi:hypothetical protein
MAPGRSFSMKFDWKFWAEFLKSMAWPGLAALVLLMFRKQIAELLTQAARALRGQPVQEASVQLDTLPELSSSWSVGSMDVRLLTPPQVFNDNSRPFFQDLLNTGPGDYVVMDLGKGQEWLTSRLFLFSLILGMVRNLRTLVFVESSSGVRRRFLATAPPEDVRRCLALRYPWLEEAWLRASAAQYAREVPGAGGSAEAGNRHPLFAGAEVEMVRSFAQDFIESIQRSGAPPEGEQERYLKSPTSPHVWEKTHWMDGERLERDLAGCLRYDWCENSPDRPVKAVVASVTRRKAPFVALVDSDRRFVGLVDRYALLDATKRLMPGS